MKLVYKVKCEYKIFLFNLIEWWCKPHCMEPQHGPLFVELVQFFRELRGNSSPRSVPQWHLQHIPSSLFPEGLETKQPGRMVVGFGYASLQSTCKGRIIPFKSVPVSTWRRWSGVAVTWQKAHQWGVTSSNKKAAFRLPI